MEEEQKPWSPDGELPLDGDGMTLHLMDAHEEAGQPGIVYLFGKVRGPISANFSCLSVSVVCRKCAANAAECSRVIAMARGDPKQSLCVVGSKQLATVSLKSLPCHAAGAGAGPVAVGLRRGGRAAAHHVRGPQHRGIQRHAAFPLHILNA